MYAIKIDSIVKVTLFIGFFLIDMSIEKFMDTENEVIKVQKSPIFGKILICWLIMCRFKELFITDICVILIVINFVNLYYELWSGLLSYSFIWAFVFSFLFFLYRIYVIYLAPLIMCGLSRRSLLFLILTRRFSRVSVFSFI